MSRKKGQYDSQDQLDLFGQPDHDAMLDSTDAPISTPDVAAVSDTTAQAEPSSLIAEIAHAPEADLIDEMLLLISQLTQDASGKNSNAGDTDYDAALMALFKQYLHILVSLRYITHIDLYFADFLMQQCSSENPRIRLGYGLLALLVSRANGLGHTVLPLDYLYSPHRWFIESEDSKRTTRIYELLQLVFGRAREKDQPLSRYALFNIDLKGAWQPILEMVSSPLVQTNAGIYLDKNYQQESRIVQYFKNVTPIALTAAEMDFLQSRIDYYFGLDESAINWQKFAAANVLLNNVSVISGGPGTGKTTTVFKILQTLVDLYFHQAHSHAGDSPFTILLAAPTGKAAARLSESILGQIRIIQDEVKDAPLEKEEAVRQQLSLIPHTGQTLHRLLMIHPFTRKPKFNRYNPLNFDLLVVDEASMIDQQMLEQLIEALPEKGRVIFLGDKDQLSSVEAGAIMHELCVYENYSEAHFSRLNQLLSGSLTSAALVNPKMPAFNYLSFLKKSYRFDANSALGTLASLINNESRLALPQQWEKIDTLMTTEATKGDHKTLTLTALPMEEAILKKMIEDAFKPYVESLKGESGIEFAEKAFGIFTRLGVLSARRTGRDGALALNQLIRKTLFPRDAHREFFHGLPIMITHNSVENNLFNGDIGLILRSETGTLRAYFEDVDSARVFSIHALPKFEPAFAMTIHKSQGSEFKSIMLFLGEEASVFLTKELFYTGITRAKESVHIFASDKAMKMALSGRVDRFSFIHQRLAASDEPL